MVKQPKRPQSYEIQKKQRKLTTKIIRDEKQNPLDRIVANKNIFAAYNELVKGKQNISYEITSKQFNERSVNTSRKLAENLKNVDLMSIPHSKIAKSFVFFHIKSNEVFSAGHDGITNNILKLSTVVIN